MISNFHTDLISRIPKSVFKSKVSAQKDTEKNMLYLLGTWLKNKARGFKLVTIQRGLANTTVWKLAKLQKWGLRVYKLGAHILIVAPHFRRRFGQWRVSGAIKRVNPTIY